MDNDQRRPQSDRFKRSRGSDDMRVSASIIAALGSALVISTSALAADVESRVGGDSSTPVAAQACLRDLESFDEKLAGVGFGVLTPEGFAPWDPPTGYSAWATKGTPQQKIRSLRAAAYVYATDGDEQSCRLVLASMRAIYAEHQELIGTEANDPKLGAAWRRAHLSRARPVTEMRHLMRAGALIGSEIRSPENEKLGSVYDVVLSPGKQEIVYLLAARGGFLGFGTKLVAIRWSDLRATEDHELYVLDASPKAVEDAPVVERRNFEKTADPEWQNAVGRYWAGVLRK